MSELLSSSLTTEPGRVKRVKGYLDTTLRPDARLIPGLVLFRWDAPLFFANAELLHERSFFAILGEAAGVYLATYPVEWVDGEDRKS